MFENFAAKLAGARKSLTIKFNALVAFSVLALPVLQDSLPQVKPFIPADLYQYAFALVTIGNLALRFKTSQPLESKGA